MFVNIYLCKYIVSLNVTASIKYRRHPTLRQEHKWSLSSRSQHDGLGVDRVCAALAATPPNMYPFCIHIESIHNRTFTLTEARRAINLSSRILDVQFHYPQKLKVTILTRRMKSIKYSISIHTYQTHTCYKPSANSSTVRQTRAQRIRDPREQLAQAQDVSIAHHHQRSNKRQHLALQSNSRAQHDLGLAKLM